VLRSFAGCLGRDEVDRCIQAAGLPPNKRRTILDDLFVPVLETYTWERVESLLRDAGFRRWRRWTAAQLDHESDPQTLVAELRLRAKLWRAGAASASSAKAEVETRLAGICDQTADAAAELIEQHRMGLMSAEAVQQAVIGTGHHRLVAERA
jgi:hypothetical protein